MTRRILIVDDEERVRRSIGRELSDIARTFEAEDPIAAMLRAIPEHGMPDLVTSDFRMPDMNGLTFLRYLAEHQPTVRRVLITGGDSSREPQDLFAETPRGTVCFTKPWDGKLRLAVIALLDNVELPAGVFVKQ